MNKLTAALACLLLTTAAVAGDVYVTKDAQGHPVYTDTPQAVPAQKVDIHVSSAVPPAAGGTTAAAKPPAQQGATDALQQAAAKQSTPDTPEQRAKRCADAQKQYQVLINNWRIYETGPNGERNYLTSEQIDEARAGAKKFMDQACADQ
jgi:hypothetical protein